MTTRCRGAGFLPVNQGDNGMAAKRSGSRKSPSSRSKSRRKYGAKAQQEVRKEMHHLKRGEHKSRQQAIAIGLSKARRAGGKVPAKKKAA